jgi:hypothetical protein
VGCSLKDTVHLLHLKNVVANEGVSSRQFQPGRVLCVSKYVETQFPEMLSKYVACKLEVMEKIAQF